MSDKQGKRDLMLVKRLAAYALYTSTFNRFPVIQPLSPNMAVINIFLFSSGWQKQWLLHHEAINNAIIWPKSNTVSEVYQTTRSAPMMSWTWYAIPSRATRGSLRCNSSCTVQRHTTHTCTHALDTNWNCWSEWVSSFLTAHQHIKGYFVPSRLLWK